MCALMLSWAALAQEQDVITVNPEAEPLSREETRGMVEAATAAFYQNEELKEALSAEITRVREVIPTDYYPAEEHEFYVLTHDGKSMRFSMETIGLPDDSGRYPLYIALHGGVGAFVALSLGYIVFAGIMGIKWALMGQMTGNLYAGMADHFFNNCIATNLLHVSTESGIDEMMIVRVLIAQLLSFFIVLAMWRYHSRKALRSR